MLFWLSDKIADALKYLSLYPFGLRLGTEHARTPLATHECSKLDCIKKSFKGGFLSYAFEHGKIFDLEEKVALAGKRARRASATSTSVRQPESWP